MLIMNMMPPISLMASLRVMIRLLIVISLYTKNPTMMAYTHAKAPTSEGVKRPSLKLPISTIGKIRAQMVSLSEPAISLKDARCSRALGNLRIRAVMATVSMKAAIMIRPLIMPAVNNLPMETSPTVP